MRPPHYSPSPSCGRLKPSAAAVPPLEVIAIGAPEDGPARWTRCARWLGLDHNKLRRPADRLETALRLIILALVLAGVPLASIGMGRAVDQVGIRQAQAEQAADHQVQAVLTQAAPAHGSPDPYTGEQTAWVPARWVAANGTIHYGPVLTAAGAGQGSAVAIWTNASGAATDPPDTHGDTVSNVFVVSTSTALLLLVALAGLQALGRCLLDRRRIRAWDAEWRAIGPRWTGHYSA